MQQRQTKHAVEPVRNVELFSADQTTVAAPAEAAAAADWCTVDVLLVVVVVSAEVVVPGVVIMDDAVVVFVVPAAGVLGLETVVTPAGIPGGTMGRTCDSKCLPLRSVVPVTIGVVDPGPAAPGDIRWDGSAC